MALFRDRVPNENRTVPFHMARSEAERRDWFARTRPWHRVHPSIVKALMDKFARPVDFEVFVILSIEQRLVGRYVELGRRLDDLHGAVVCAAISGYLTQIGSEAVQKMGFAIEKRQFQAAEAPHRLARNALESALILEPGQVAAYYGLAVIFSMLGKDDRRVHYAEQGLMKLSLVRNSPIRESKLFKDIDQNLDLLEQNLVALRDA